MNSRLNDRCVELHTASANAGWWPDEVTPELIATKLMLVVTELSEADDGFHSGEKDQHLPHLDGFAVELADARIRKIGRAHVCTPVPNAQLVCRLLLENRTSTPCRSVAGW